MQPYQGVRWVASNECTNGVLDNCGFEVLQQSKGAVIMVDQEFRAETR